MLNLWVLSYVGSTRRFMNLSVRRKQDAVCVHTEELTLPRNLGTFTDESRAALENDVN